MARSLFASIIVIVAIILTAQLACTAPAEFEVTSLDVRPQEVTVGEQVIITVVVRNIGGTEGIYTATPAVDGVAVETKSIAMAPGSIETLTFSLIKDKAGTYQVAIDGLVSTLTIKEKEVKKLSSMES